MPDLVFKNVFVSKPFQYKPSKRLPVQSQQLEQSLKYVYS